VSLAGRTGRREPRSTICLVAKANSQTVAGLPPAEEGFTSLNDTLYTAAPQDYFERRLLNLALVGSKRAQLDELLREGLEFAT